MSEACKLCKKENELQDSHVIPKLIYRYMRRHQDKTMNLNGLLTLDSRKRKIDITQYQWKMKLFCKECELVLSKNETKFARILHDINEISKDKIPDMFYSPESLEELKKEKPTFVSELEELIKNNYFSEEKAFTLKYFAASFVLRQLYIIDNTLGTNEVSLLEDYLLGLGDGKFTLFVKINYGQSFKAFSSTFALDKIDTFKHYNFIVPEMWFHLIFDIQGKLGAEKIVVIPEDFFKDKIIRRLLSQPYQGASLTEKAKNMLNMS